MKQLKQKVLFIYFDVNFLRNPTKQNEKYFLEKQKKIVNFS